MEEENTNDKEGSFKLVEVPTQHTLAVQTPKGEYVSTEYLIVDIANSLAEINKVIEEIKEKLNKLIE